MAKKILYQDHARRAAPCRDRGTSHGRAWRDPGVADHRWAAGLRDPVPAVVQHGGHSI